MKECFNCIAAELDAAKVKFLLGLSPPMMLQLVSSENIHVTEEHTLF